MFFEALARTISITFNRTSMELKLKVLSSNYRVRGGTFNRTSMELKSVRHKGYRQIVCRLLIEPVWN